MRTIDVVEVPSICGTKFQTGEHLASRVQKDSLDRGTGFLLQLPGLLYISIRTEVVAHEPYLR